MAFSSVLASAVGILLLIIAAYVLVGGTLTTAQTVANAQADMTAIHVKMLGTAIQITYTNISAPGQLDLSVLNTGTEPVTDLPHLDVLLKPAGSAPVLKTKDKGWTLVSIFPDSVHPNQWDPGESMNITVEFSEPSPEWVQVTTANGAFASAYIKT
ncbi:MAG TPA: flagellar protein FlaF [Methanoregulaceae archaeon]|nr:flagellar protein FlaF [Methanoregulaceae archaeon]